MGATGDQGRGSHHQEVPEGVLSSKDYWIVLKLVSAGGEVVQQRIP